MDTTIKYIKMCEEVWKYLRQEIGYYDVVAYRYVSAGYIKKGVCVYCKVAEFWAMKEKNESKTEPDYIFVLWKQDQLQEMIAETSGFDGKRMIGLELCNLWAWYQQNRPGDIGIEMKLWPSWEQLWLKFIMKKKYNKLWDDKKEKWIKDEKNN